MEHGYGKCINTLKPRQNGRHFPYGIFKCIFLNENVKFLINIPLKFVPKGQIKNVPALVQIMAWCHPGDKPLSEPMRVNLLSHMCVTRPHWVTFDGWVYLYYEHRQANVAMRLQLGNRRQVYCIATKLALQLKIKSPNAPVHLLYGTW